MRFLKKIFTNKIAIVALCLSFSLVAFSYEVKAAESSAPVNAQIVSTNMETTSRAVARSYSTAHYHCPGNPLGGVVGTLDIDGYPYWRNDMTITVSGFSSETDIRIIIKNDDNRTIFDTFDSSVGCLNTSGYYSIDVNLPPSDTYHITCDIYGVNVTAGDVYFTIK